MQERFKVLTRHLVVNIIAADKRFPASCQEIIDIVLVSLFLRLIFEPAAADRGPKLCIRLGSPVTGRERRQWVSVMQRQKSLPVFTQPPLLEDMRNGIPRNRIFGHTNFCSGDPAQMTDNPIALVDDRCKAWRESGVA